MKPTKKQIQAVKNTIEHWTWLKKNPLKYTFHYPFKGITPFNSCYLCSAFPNKKFGCGLCPLNTKILLCCNKNETDPYILHSDAISQHNIKESKKQCQRIINACKRWLKKYGEL
jgi:hypothetical protein